MHLVALGLIALLACGDNFSVVRQTDTIEAYEAFIADNPTSRWQLQANERLEQLYLEKAKNDESLEGYDAYLDRFPEGMLMERARAEREEFLYDWARAENSAEGWQKFIDEYPRGDKKRMSTATRMKAVHEYLPHLDVGEIRQAEINMAENPEGEKDGWGWKVDVTNNGEATLERVVLSIQYLSEDDRSLNERSWGMVSPTWKVPVEEIRKVPMKPGETRTWDWSEAKKNMPEAWGKKAKVFVSRIDILKE